MRASVLRTARRATACAAHRSFETRGGKAGTTAPSTGLLPGQEAGDIACGKIKCALDCEDECGWSTAAVVCVSASTGARTSAKERDARLGDCAPAAPAAGAAGGGADDGEGGGMAVIGVVVALVVLVCVAGGVFAYFKRGKEEQVWDVGAAYTNPAYTQSVFAVPSPANQDDGELYAVQQGTDGHTYQDTYSMEKAPGVQGGAGRGQQQAQAQGQGQENTLNLATQQQFQGQEETHNLGHESAGQQAKPMYLDTAPHPEPEQEAAAPGYLHVAGSNTAETAMTSYDCSSDDEEI